MSAHNKRRAQRGLTLVEALVALGIFGAVAAASVGILSITLNGRAQIERTSEEIAALDRARALLKEDFAQIVDRPVRSGNAGGLESSFFGGASLGLSLGSNRDELLLKLTRAGQTNPGWRYARSTLARVSYVQKADGLHRISAPFLDAVNDTPQTDTLIMPNVTQAQFEFYKNGRWEAVYDTQRDKALPKMVRLKLIHPDYGRIEQLFLIEINTSGDGE